MADITYGSTVTVAPKPLTPKRRRAPVLSQERRKEIARKNQVKQDRIKTDIAEWYQETVTLSQRLSQKYGKKPGHFLNMMFFGGTKMGRKRKTNLYNAWGYHIAKQAQEGMSVSHLRSLSTHKVHVSETTVPAKLLALEKENRDAYDKLTDEEKAQLIQELDKKKEMRTMGYQLTARGRTQDVKNVAREIEQLLHGLKARAGVEAFFCIVRNSTEYQMLPQWFITTPELDRYLRGAIRKGWDPEHIGCLAEAFAVAGCDFAMFLHTSKAKADWIKGEIRDRINEMLSKRSNLPLFMDAKTCYSRRHHRKS
ncbi:hypothetical protein OBBRIDRAFT_742107 [Obba rivulosa]|uniref:Uncharacterized protein n=1 Tax=Obba rivulosa TaxID=1052685 RepID=A0A8E2DDV4_9APHY|nr:hypothetical protein OBBRIDRAFT_742107 [Obba rivulosa]